MKKNKLSINKFQKFQKLVFQENKLSKKDGINFLWNMDTIKIMNVY